MKGSRRALQRPPLRLSAIARRRPQLPELEPLRSKVLLLGRRGWRLLLLWVLVLVLTGMPLLQHRWPLQEGPRCQAVPSSQLGARIAPEHPLRQ